MLLEFYFFATVAQAFDVKFEDGLGELSIVDQLGTPVRNESVLNYVLNVFSKSGSFYLKVVFNQSQESLVTNSITSMV